MPPRQEQQALAFLALVAALGAGVRAAGTHRFEQALAVAEADAASSAATGTAPRPGTAPASRAAVRGADAALARQRRAVDSARAARPGRSRGAATPLTGPIDVDVASAAELERLPRIGPAMAARIVAVRESLGGFGALEALRHVPGIGPATLSSMAPHVTFSSRHRPSPGVGGVAPRAGPRTPRGPAPSPWSPPPS